MQKATPQIGGLHMVGAFLIILCDECYKYINVMNCVSTSSKMALAPLLVRKVLGTHRERDLTINEHLNQ